MDSGKLKIAYLSFEAPDGKSGVAKKIEAQATEWRLQGCEVSHFLLRPSALEKSEVRFVATKRHPSATLNAVLNLGALLKELRSYAPDVIYMREMQYFPGLFRALNVAPYLVEVNSDAAMEYKRLSKFKWLYYRLFGQRLLNLAAGIVFVSKELKRVHSFKASKLQTVIANGYEFKRHQIIEKQSNGSVNFLFVASPNQAWHGIEDLEDLARSLPDAVFHVVMANYTSDVKNIVCHGALYGDALKEIYAQADVGIGSLAMHRNKMEEASPLKVREYLAYGLPVILPYYDTDLHHLSIDQGVLAIENRSGAARKRSKEIYDFAIKWQGKRVPHAITAPILSYEHKERQRLEFMRSALHRG